MRGGVIEPFLVSTGFSKSKPLDPADVILCQRPRLCHSQVRQVFFIAPPSLLVRRLSSFKRVEPLRFELINTGKTGEGWILPRVTCQDRAELVPPYAWQLKAVS
jgi:hypothetical protein